MLAAPSIWLPRREFRLPSWSDLAWFTAGKLQRKPASGKLQRNPATGKMRRNTAGVTACCCTSPFGACSLCTVSTASSWTLSVNDIVLCGCQTGNTRFEEAVGHSANGTFTLTRFGTCEWRYLFPDDTVYQRTYSGGGTACNTDVTDQTPAQWILGLSGGILGASWTLQLIAVLKAFESVNASAVSCTSALVGSNDFTSCASTRLGTGGTFTLTPHA